MFYNTFKNMLPVFLKRAAVLNTNNACCPRTLVRMRDKQYLKEQHWRPCGKWKPHYHDKQADVIDLVLHSCSLVALVDGAKKRQNQDTGNL